jgi:hypothetical protein
VRYSICLNTLSDLWDYVFQKILSCMFYRNISIRYESLLLLWLSFTIIIRCYTSWEREIDSFYFFPNRSYCALSSILYRFSKKNLFKIEYIGWQTRRQYSLYHVQNNCENTNSTCKVANSDLKKKSKFSEGPSINRIAPFMWLAWSDST